MPIERLESRFNSGTSAGSKTIAPLIGEAFHGPAEVYRERPGITKRLIQEKGFSAIAVEADWPDAYWIDCYVR